MGRLLSFTGPRTVAFEEYPDPPLAPGEVRVTTLFSGISSGTELTAYRGTNPYLHKAWDPARRLFVEADQPAHPYPLRGWGYEEVGEVVEVAGAADEDLLGATVYGAWGHRTHHVLPAADARARRLPAGLPPVAGIFSHIGAVALNGVHDAGIRIGERVLVFGLGVPGQIVAQLASASGATVIGVDPLPARREAALASGALDLALDPAGGVAERVKELTGGRGADVSIEVSGVAAALNEAIRATAYSARVVAMGFYQGGANGLYLGEEFHHNRVAIVGSQISGVAPELSGRWDRSRLARTVMELQARGALRLEPLITHTYPFARAAEAFALLDRDPSEALQVVLDMREGT